MLMLFLFACEIGLVRTNPAYLNNQEEDAAEEFWASSGSDDSDWETEVSSLSDDDSSAVDEESWSDENIEEEDENTDAFEEDGDDSQEEIEETEDNSFDSSNDQDGDGFSPDQGDCNDFDNTIFPGNPGSQRTRNRAFVSFVRCFIRRLLVRLEPAALLRRGG